MSEILYSTRYFSVERDPRGVTFLGSGDAVMVVPVAADGAVLMAVEPSAAFGEDLLLLPAGEVEPGEPRADTGNRELQEEIGFKAGRMDFLGEIRPWAKYLRVRVHLFLARDLTESRLEGDEDYEIVVKPVRFTEIEKLVREGELLDAGVISALLLAREFLARSP